VKNNFNSAQIRFIYEVGLNKEAEIVQLLLNAHQSADEEAEDLFLIFLIRYNIIYVHFATG